MMREALKKAEASAGPTVAAETNSDGDTGITISANTSSSSTLLIADSYAGTGGTTAYRGSIEYDHATDHMAVSTAATEKMRIKSCRSIICLAFDICGNIRIHQIGFFTCRCLK